MRFVTYSFRNGLELATTNPAHSAIWSEVTDSIACVDELSLRSCILQTADSTKSLSRCINSMLREQFENRGWNAESPIFQGDEFSERFWRLDFAKPPFSIEVSFNHGEAIAWNLVKPVLAGELNHVDKAIQTRFGIVICATQGLKDAGGFDGAVGEYEKVIRYLKPLRTLLTIPTIVVGLLPPERFSIVHRVGANHRRVAEVRDEAPEYWTARPYPHESLPTSDRDS